MSKSIYTSYTKSNNVYKCCGVHTTRFFADICVQSGVSYGEGHAVDSGCEKSGHSKAATTKHHNNKYKNKKKHKKGW